MRLSFSTLACPDWTLEQAADAGIRYGYEGIELRLLDGELVPSSLNRSQRARIRRVCADTGLALCCLGTSFKLADPQESLDDAYRYVELAADLDVGIMRLFGGAPYGENWDTTVRRSVERLIALADRGRAFGVRVALETHDTFATGSSVTQVMSAVPNAYAGVLWDVLNPYHAGETAEQTWRHVRDRLMHIHVKDGGAGPDPTECRLLGKGVVPVQSMLQLVVTHGYDGWFSVEWEKKWQPQIADPEIALPQYANLLRAYLLTVG